MRAHNSAVKFAFFDELLTGERIGSSASTKQSLDEHFDEVQLADRLGIDYFFFPEHQCSQFYGTAAGSAVCGVLSQITSKIRFGPMVYVLPLNDPGKLAGEVSFLDQVTGGRLEVGIGSGSIAKTLRIFNIEWGEKTKMTFEALDVLLNAWTKEVFSYNGKYYKYTDYRVGYPCLQKPHPPLWYPSRSLDTVEWLGRNGISTIQWEFTPTELAKTLFAAHRKAEESKGHGGPLNRAIQRKVVVAASDQEAKKIAMTDYDTYWKAFLGQMKDETQVEVSGTNQLIVERVKQIGEFSTAESHNLVIAGSPSNVVERIRALTEEVDANVFAFATDFGKDSHRHSRESLRLMSKEVIPKLRSA